MIDRRTLLASAPAAAVVAAGAAEAAPLAPSRDVKLDVANLPQELKDAHRLQWKQSDGEARLNFIAGLVKARGRLSGSPEMQASREAYLRSKGYNSLDDVSLGHEECFNILMGHQGHRSAVHFGSHTQQLMWDAARRALLKDYDYWMAEMDAWSTKGPGTLKLDAACVIPDSARHEIHQQPGGFVGDPLSGAVYHYAVTPGFFAGRAEHDENQIQLAQLRQKPADGRVLRILDMGCGIGQSTTSMKLRFPDAEVWGIDVGAPMLRYGHMRAAKMGIEVHYKQAENGRSGFPDGYFDMVIEHLMFHEASVENQEQIVAEAYRVLRPGGVLDHADMITRGNPTNHPADTLPGRARLWETMRINNYEPHWINYAESNFPDCLRRNGFAVQFDGGSRVSSGKMWATKPLKA